jgi:hypothetical protein
MSGSTLDELHRHWLKRPGYQAAYETLGQESAVASALIEARAHAGLTQQEVAERNEADVSTQNPHWGATLDAFLDEDGIREAARAGAVMRMLAWQLGREMERRGMTKARLAELIDQFSF